MLRFDTVIAAGLVLPFLRHSVYYWYKADVLAMEEHLSNVDWYALIHTNPNALASWSAFRCDMVSCGFVYTLWSAHCQQKRPKKCPREIVKLVRRKRVLCKKCALFPNDVRV